MADDKSSAWVEITVSDGFFLDEITAALRDANIAVGLSEPVAAGMMAPVRTRFGAKASPGSKIIEVRPEAQSVLRSIYESAEGAV